MRMMRRVRSLISAAAILACNRSSDESAARLANARPYLASAAGTAKEILAGTRRCESPLPGYPGCEHDHVQVLLIAPDGGEGGAGRRVAALVFVPPGRRPALAMTQWRFDSLGAAVGHGWHQVTAIATVD